MPPLITREEALALGEIEDHAAIEALVERAWQARTDRFGDSTDLCSLVNAKSGGCAEDCGFCAQSKYAEADTPMHAMMSPEQILEHARAAEAAGAHRFCMVTQGQGLSKRDFQNIVEGAKLVAEHTNLKRCASIGHMSVARAKALKDAGIQRVHHNVETAESYYDEVSTTVRYDGRIRTIEAVKEAGLETCVGGILNLGETREQRVEMAFQLAELDPTSVPINLLNPRPGTKFGDRDFMDPWEAVKWIAIFRLILPDALFRLCGGRVENLGELQPLAVKAGLNGVMMGNFLTTLGSEPEEDRAMFEELGLNVARQPDNGSNPRPDNRSGWLDGEAPGTPIDDLIKSQAEANFWNPATPAAAQEEELGAAAPGRRAQPRPRGGPGRPGRPVRAAHDRVRGGGVMNEIQERLEEIRELGLYRKLRLISGPQGPRVLLDGRPVLLLCSNNYLGLADHPRVREAAADAAMRYGVGAGASRLVSGNMTIHRRLEEQLAEFKGTPACVLFGSGYLANTGVVSALAREGDVVFSDALNHASIVDGCRLARAETFVYDHCDMEHLEWGLQEADGRGSLIVTDGVFSMDGDVAPLAEIVELAQRYDARVMVDDAHGVGALGPEGRGAVADAGVEDEVDVVVGTLGKSLGSYGAYVCCDRTMAKYLVNTARSLIFSTALPPPAVAGAMAALELLVEQPQRVLKLQRNARLLADALADEGIETGSETQILPVVIGSASAAVDGLGAPARARHLRAGDQAAHRAGRHVAAAARRDGVALGVRAEAGRARDREDRARGGAAARRGRLRLRKAGDGRAARARVRPPERSRVAAPRARPVRHRHRHRRRQVGRRRRDLRRARRARPAGRRVQAGRHGPRRPARASGRPTTSCSPSVTGQEPSAVAPWLFGPPASPHLAAELDGATLEPPELLAAARRAGGMGGRARLRGGRRPDGAAHARATSCATSRSTCACRSSSRPGPGSARSTTRCSRWRPHAPPGSSRSPS